MQTRDALKSLAALSEETRLGTYRLLVQEARQGLPARAIASKTGLNGATLSFHLKELTHDGGGAARQHGRFVIYTAN